MRADRPKRGATAPDTLDTPGESTEWGRYVMKGFVLQGPGQFSSETVPDPGIKDATDVIARVPHADVSVYLLPTTARLDAAKRFGADAVVDTRETEEAYDVLAKAADTGALKVVLGGTRHEEAALPAAGREDVTRHA